jgi:hypothetical protein
MDVEKNKLQLDKLKLLQYADHFDPAEYNSFIRTTASMLEYMLDFYGNEKNVFQSEEERLEIVKQLQECLGIYHEYSKGYEYWSIEDSDKKAELAEKFFSTIGKYICYWWD